MPDIEITPADVEMAATRIPLLAQRTPVLTSRTFNRMTGVETFFKCENFQRGGAFKIRGAANFLFSMPAEDLPKGVVAYSSGNHAQAVAIAAQYRHSPATIVMPDDAPMAKVEATKGYGAKVLRYDRLREDRVAIGKAAAAESGAAIVPPFDHPWIIAGQGTAAKELLEDVGPLDALLTPIGGGGLIAGSAIWAKARFPGLRVFGVEPEDANDTALSLAAGQPVTIPPPNTIADGLRSQRPGDYTFPVIQKLVEDVILVSDEEIRAAQQFLLTRMKIVVEPSGAVPAAALLHGKLPAGIRRAGLILSGGNI